MKQMFRRLFGNILRTLTLLVIGVSLLSTDSSIAKWLHIPALAPILLSAGWLFVAAALSHVARIILFPTIDLLATAKKAIQENNIAAGQVVLGICIVLAALLMSQARANPLVSVLVQEQQTLWPDVPAPWTMAGQVEAESNWKPTAELKTSREHGAGLGQLTRVYRADGSIVFDRLADARKLHPSLADWSWEDRFDAARQLRALVLMNKIEWRVTVGAAAEDDQWAFVLCAYNGGRGGLSRDRSLCSGTEGCDPSKWFGNVELNSWRAKTAVSGYGRSFFQINRDYVKSILTKRRLKYVDSWRDAHTVDNQLG
jgi:hypothetical protein